MTRGVAGGCAVSATKGAPAVIRSHAIAQACAREAAAVGARIVSEKYGIPLTTVKTWKLKIAGRNQTVAERVAACVVQDAPITTRGVSIALGLSPRHTRDALRKASAAGMVRRLDGPVPRFVAPRTRGKP